MGLDITDEQRSNLLRLADFLDRSVPPPEFGMSRYFRTSGTTIEAIEDRYDRALEDELDPMHTAAYSLSRETVYRSPLAFPAVIPLGAYTACGTVACAVGHGPLAGIEAMPGETWYDYSLRVFGLRGERWSFLFAAEWSGIDDTPKGAAARIRCLLDTGEVPTIVDPLYPSSRTPIPYCTYRNDLHEATRTIYSKYVRTEDIDA